MVESTRQAGDGDPLRGAVGGFVALPQSSKGGTMNPVAAAVSYVQMQALRGAVRLAPHWFEERLLRAAAEAAESIAFTPGRVFVGQMLRFARDMLPKAGPQCRKKALENFVVGAIKGKLERDAYYARTGFQPPYLLVVSPTMRCNLRCTGCYAGQFKRDGEMPYELLDRIVGEARAMGMYFMTLSGGEPFFRKDLMDLFEKYHDMYFQVYTNGTLIDERLADRLAALGHVFPSISVEGFREETDARRGRGVFRRVTAAMDRLRERGVLFGFSATATRQNNELLVSDEFVDFYRAKGCVVGWYFNSLPIGSQPDLDRMPTPRQRLYRRRRMAELRERLPMLLMDFWNDGALVGGCMAAGRYYAHINVNGDVEPCVFCQFAADNLRDKSLHEALNSPFFLKVRSLQPYSHNHLRGCMIIDHPHILREVVRECGAHPTCPGGDALLTQAAAGLDRYAGEWRELADDEWAAEGSADVELSDRLKATRHPQ
jgi:MoaA/NifB/PqqE/SkfB family radical SAM enzyme